MVPNRQIFILEENFSLHRWLFLINASQNLMIESVLKKSMSAIEFDFSDHRFMSAEVKSPLLRSLRLLFV